MFKQVVIAFAFVMMVALVHSGEMPELSEEAKEQLIEITKKCMEETGVEQKVLEEMDKETPTDQKGRCFMGCFYREYGYIKDDKIDVEAVMEGSKKLGMPSDDLEKLRVIIEQCEKEVGAVSDTCEIGPKASECIKPKIIAAGIEYKI